MPSEFVDQHELAAELRARGIDKSPRTLESWRASGIGPAWLKLGGTVRYRRVDIDSWIEMQRVVPANAFLVGWPKEALSKVRERWDESARLRAEFAGNFGELMNFVNAIKLGLRPRGHTKLPPELRGIFEGIAVDGD